MEVSKILNMGRQDARKLSQTASGIKRAAIYSRTAWKKSGALSYQEADARKYCEQHGYEIIESLVIAEVASPSTLHRPGLQKLLEAARERQFDVLVSWEFGCLSKSRADLQYIFRIFAEQGIVYETVQNF